MAGIYVGESHVGVNYLDGGAYRVAGTVAIDGTPTTPVHRRVRLLERITYRVVAEQWSDPVTGAFEFRNLANQQYLVVAEDYTRYYNVVTADAITPVP